MFVVKLVAERNTFNIRHTSSQSPTAPFARRQNNGFLHPLHEGCFVLCPESGSDGADPLYVHQGAQIHGQTDFPLKRSDFG